MELMDINKEDKLIYQHNTIATRNPTEYFSASRKMSHWEGGKKQRA